MSSPAAPPSRWPLGFDDAPRGPGVYLMRDAGDAVLYIGKAKSLRTRLRSYRSPERLEPRVRLFLRRVERVEYILTDSELEALILENSLIKAHRPRYNISLRDDKTYPFLRLSVQEDFPTLTVVRRPASDGARYFGPYVPAGAMRATLRLLQRLFPLRRCRTTHPAGRGRPCLNFQMGRCLGACTGRVSREEYAGLTKQVLLFLQGKGTELTADLRHRMEALSRELRYEEAAAVRDQIAAVESMLRKQKAHLPGAGDLDVIGTVRLGGRRAVALLHLRAGRIVGSRAMTVREDPWTGDEGDAVASVVRAVYRSAGSVPPEVLLPEETGERELLESWLAGLAGRTVRLKVPRRGPRRALVVLASRNALRVLDRGAREGEGPAALQELARLAGTRGTLRTAAFMDVSSLSGGDAVASLVWWEAGDMRRDRYRRFRIGGRGGRDDTARLAGAAARFARRSASGSWEGPDVLVLDGGRGHLAAGHAALDAAGWRPKLLLAIAKPRPGRGHDAVYFGDSGEALDLSGAPAVLRLMQRGRDEAHRSAVAYHRLLRGKRIGRSGLDGIAGLGRARTQRVLRRFGSLARLRRASFDEIADTPGLPTKVARAIYERLRA